MITYSNVYRCLAYFVFFAPLLADAQTIVSDGKVNTSVKLINNTYEITEGRKEGGNLFHSFSRFDLDSGFIADFKDTVDGGITDIISRVTGKFHSNINGLIRSSIPGANLYMINPNGIVFGEDAALDIKGSFYATTADELRFLSSNNEFFSATDPDKSTFTSAPPEAFGFLSREPKGISIQKTRFETPVSAGESFSLVGGSIDITRGHFETSEATLNFVGVGGPGQAQIDSDIIKLEQEIPRGDVTISGGSRIISNDYGHTHIVGDVVIIEEFSNIKSEISENNIDIPISYSGITIDGVELILRRDATLSSTGDIKIHTRETTNMADRSRLDTREFGGNISITTGTLNVNNGTINTESVSGQSGDITIVASNAANFDIGRISTATTSGQAGNISISVEKGNLRVERFTIANDVSTGVGGEINMSALNGQIGINRSNILSRTASSTGAGNVTIEAQSLHLGERVRIEGNTIGTGPGANINIKATEELSLDGSGTSIKTTSEEKATGSGGTINIKASRLDVRNGAEISANTRGVGQGGSLTVNAANIAISDGAQLSTDSIANVNNQNTDIGGHAGSITIKAGRFMVSNEGKISATTSTSGIGGSIDIQATDIQLREASSISAKSTGSGDSGFINISKADTVSLLDNSEITVRTEKAEANAGDITINAKTLLHLRNKSAIETSAAVNDPDGKGSGGDITIDPKIVVLDGASSIRANAQKGKGGDIQITITDGGALFQSPDSVIDASAGPAGLDGTVEIIRTDSDVIRGTLVLPESFLDAAKLLSEKCMARTAAGASSFVVSGRSGVPPGPDALLPDYVSVLDEELVGEQGDEVAYTLPVSDLWSTQNRLSRLIIECNPI